MKRTLTFLLAAALCLSGCSEMDGAFSFLNFNRSDSGEETVLYTVDTTMTSAMLGGSMGQIKLSPYTVIPWGGESTKSFQNYSHNLIGKDGGVLTITAYYPEEEAIPLNDYYTIMGVLSDSYDYGRLEYSTEEFGKAVKQIEAIKINQRKIDSFSTEYEIIVPANQVGKEYGTVIKIYDSSQKKEDGTPLMCEATITINQAAE